MNIDAAVKFARVLKVSVSEFSPQLASDLAKLHDPGAPIERDPSHMASQNADDLSPSLNGRLLNSDAESVEMSRLGQQLSQTQADTVTVSVFDARASMGLGLAEPEHDTVVDHLRLTRAWVRTHLPTISSLESLAVLTAYGDSMTPTFSDGDILLVDRGVYDIKVDAVYVLALNNELYIKRIQRRITDGAVIVKSDNPLYDPVVVENGTREGLRVLGRVVWAWNGRKL